MCPEFENFWLRGCNQPESEEAQKFAFRTFRVDFSVEIYCFGSNELHRDCAPRGTLSFQILAYRYFVFRVFQVFFL